MCAVRVSEKFNGTKRTVRRNVHIFLGKSFPSPNPRQRVSETKKSENKINHDKLDFNESFLMDTRQPTPGGCFSLISLLLVCHLSCRLFYLQEKFSKVDQRYAAN